MKETKARRQAQEQETGSCSGDRFRSRRQVQEQEYLLVAAVLSPPESLGCSSNTT